MNISLQQNINPMYNNKSFLRGRYNNHGLSNNTYLAGLGYNFQKILYSFFLKIFLTFINSVDPDEMQHYAAFHLGLHYLQKYSFRGFPNTKGIWKMIIKVTVEMPLLVKTTMSFKRTRK